MGVFFEPHTGIGLSGITWYDISDIDDPRLFQDVNRSGGIVCEFSNEQSFFGNKSIKMTYEFNEGQAEIKPFPFAHYGVTAGDVAQLFCRKYEYYAPGWEGNWPVGMKTSRYFSHPAYRLQDPRNRQDINWFYMSEKLIYQTYACTCNEEYGLGLNCAIVNLDLKETYKPDQLFGNNLPYIRTGHWYKYETWVVANSAPDVPDGALQIWIDDVLVYNNISVPYKSNIRKCPFGGGWKSMWFGGNYSGARCGAPSVPVHRYIDGLYLSTTLDRDPIPVNIIGQQTAINTVLVQTPDPIILQTARVSRKSTSARNRARPRSSLAWGLSRAIGDGKHRHPKAVSNRTGLRSIVRWER